MTDPDRDSLEPPDGPGLEYLLENLEKLEETVDSEEEREQVEYALEVARRIPGTRYLERSIDKYTTRDMAEAFVGGILLSLPLLVEDGVFEIAEWFTEHTLFGIPVFLVANVTFVVALTIGLLYWADFRNVNVTKPILGFIPRRLIGVLVVTFLTATMLLVLWGRHTADDPTTLELFGRITVIWAAAAIGGALGDILPGESAGHDITVENLEDIVKPDGE